MTSPEDRPVSCPHVRTVYLVRRHSGDGYGTSHVWTTNPSSVTNPDAIVVLEGEVRFGPTSRDLYRVDDVLDLVEALDTLDPEHPKELVSVREATETLLSRLSWEDPEDALDEGGRWRSEDVDHILDGLEDALEGVRE